VRVLFSILLGGCILGLSASVASAQTIQLTTCSASDLAAAVATANTNGQDDTIFLKQNCTYTLASQLEIKPDGGHSLRIFGFGTATVSGGGATIVFEIDQGANLTVRQLTVTQGTTGVDNKGTVNVMYSTVTRNGLGIISGGHATIAHSTVSDNSNNSYGGVANISGSMMIANSVISGNIDGPTVNGTAGGFDNFDSATATIVASTISDNTGGTAGGIENSVSATLRIYASTISSNVAASTNQSALGTGGGIFEDDYNASSTSSVWVTDSTIADNTAVRGGGVYADVPGKVSLHWTTVSGNTASGNGGGNIAGQIGLEATILAGGSSHGGDCWTQSAPYDLGYNLADDGTCGLNLSNHSRNGTASGLDPNGLQDNGGPTKTIALMPGSPAIGFVPTSAKPPIQDQRLKVRPDSDESFTDIGAYEAQDG
jgi:fibronectin-binding autotransporter adhesin